MSKHTRILLKLLGAFLCLDLHTAHAAEPGVTDTEIVMGQPIDLTGPLAALTPDIIHASLAFLNGVNENGGVHGRKIRVLTKDDGYVVANTINVVNDMIDKKSVFALMQMTGTANVAAVLPLLAKENPPVPLFAPFTGANLVRTPAINHVFNIRASYTDEAERMVQHLATLGSKHIAVVWSNNSFGKDGLLGVQRALEKRGMKLYADAPIEANGSDTDKAVGALHDLRPQAIILITSGAATVTFIKSYRKLSKGTQLYTLSVMGTQATLRSLGADGVGTVVASVVPFPWAAAHPLAREYRAAMQVAGYSNLSFLGLESYINAKVLVEALRLAGRDLTRTKFVKAMASIKGMDLGGFEVGFSMDSRQGSHFVELTIVGPGEKFIK
jgi:branched-chain amino acid transport system substrate-binding protein